VCVCRNRTDFARNGTYMFKKRPLLDVLRRNPKKLAGKELEKSKKLEIAVPRPLSFTYDYVITTQLKI